MSASADHTRVACVRSPLSRYNPCARISIGWRHCLPHHPTGLQGDAGCWMLDAGQDSIASHRIASHLMVSPLSESPLSSDTRSWYCPCRWYPALYGYSSRRRSSDNTNNNNNNNSNMQRRRRRRRRWERHAGRKDIQRKIHAHSETRRWSVCRTTQTWGILFAYLVYTTRIEANLKEKTKTRKTWRLQWKTVWWHEQQEWHERAE